jgi:hypothetical protein
MSMIVELGGIELALASRFWASRPIYSRKVLARVARVAKILQSVPAFQVQRQLKLDIDVETSRERSRR